MRAASLVIAGLLAGTLLWTLHVGVEHARRTDTLPVPSPATAGTASPRRTLERADWNPTDSKPGPSLPNRKDSRTPHASELVQRAADLARSLEQEPFHRPSWDTRARATFADLTATERALLEASLALPHLPDGETLVLAEWLRLAQDERQRLVAEPPPEVLRALWKQTNDQPERARIALRALAALGSEEDRAALARAAETRDARGAGALWALGAARTPAAARVLLRIAARVEAPADEPGTDDERQRALVALEELARSASWALSPAQRQATEHGVTLLAHDSRYPCSLRARALTVLLRLDEEAQRGGPGSMAIHELAFDREAPFELRRRALSRVARNDEPGVRTRLAEALRESTQGEEQLVYAELLAPTIDAEGARDVRATHDPAAAEAVEVLGGLLASDQPLVRRRAAYALGRSGVLGWNVLEESLRNEGDSRLLGECLSFVGVPAAPEGMTLSADLE